ncbi:MAG: ion channel [Bacteroidota bacterium]
MTEEEKQQANPENEAAIPTEAEKKKEFVDLGFGTKIGPKTQRLINTDGSFNVRKTGGGIGAIHPYQYMITIPWWQVFVIILTTYTLINLVFACLYMGIGIERLSDVPPPSGSEMQDFLNQLGHAFYFSAQTFTTVGYGTISPIGNVASLLASFEALLGLMGFALVTGVLFGRFSKPTAKIRFSDHSIIAPYRGINSYQFRIVNRRQNQLIELEAQLVMTWFEWIDGQEKQQFFRLPLERDKVALFPLTWTIVHPIDEESPLYQVTKEELEEMNAEFLIIIKSYDDTFAQTVHSRMSYKAEDVVWGAKYVKAFYPDENGQTVVEVDKISKCEKAELNEY